MGFRFSRELGPTMWALISKCGKKKAKMAFVREPYSRYQPNFELPGIEANDPILGLRDYKPTSGPNSPAKHSSI